MPAFDFPPNPADPNPPQVGDTFTPAGSDVTYTWNGTVWNASVGQAAVGVSLVTGGDGIDTLPANGIVATGSVSVNDTVARTTGDQTIGGVKTFSSTIYGDTQGAISTGQISLTSASNGSGAPLGAITHNVNAKLTFSTTDNATGFQFITPADQGIDIINGATVYARFNAADNTLRIGGDVAANPLIKLGATGDAVFSGNVTSANITSITTALTTLKTQAAAASDLTALKAAIAAALASF